MIGSGAQVPLSWNYASNKKHDVLTRIMSEESINKKDDSQQAVGDAADNSEVILDETGDTVKPGPRGIANKVKNPNIATELDKENLNSDDK
jgi:hypothetical protein